MTPDHLTHLCVSFVDLDQRAITRRMHMEKRMVAYTRDVGSLGNYSDRPTRAASQGCRWRFAERRTVVDGKTTRTAEAVVLRDL
jgi:hypothetical protein